MGTWARGGEQSFLMHPARCGLYSETFLCLCLCLCLFCFCTPAVAAALFPWNLLFPRPGLAVGFQGGMQGTHKRQAVLARQGHGQGQAVQSLVQVLPMPAGFGRRDAASAAFGTADGMVVGGAQGLCRGDGSNSMPGAHASHDAHLTLSHASRSRPSPSRRYDFPGDLI